MDADIHFTSEDCKQCCHSTTTQIGGEYPNHEWVCTLGYYIEGQRDSSKKECGLPEGEFYRSVRTSESISNRFGKTSIEDISEKTWGL